MLLDSFSNIIQPSGHTALGQVTFCVLAWRLKNCFSFREDETRQNSFEHKTRLRLNNGDQTVYIIKHNPLSAALRGEKPVGSFRQESTKSFEPNMNSCDVINSNITSQPCSHKPCKHAKSFEVYLKLCAKVILKLKYT